ncbi:acyl-phosphate glycerol 3-phosphate acyltransferase [bacterium B17]|nr:acyl-phosphate glycerol 3-phosphate acyltransferase [bacterium B17]
MNQNLIYCLCGITAYLFGAIPFGLLAAKSKGIDIRTAGSGNIGATNVLRVMGKKWGILVLLLDAMKGFIPAKFFPILAASQAENINIQGLGVACALLAVAGHNWPVYLKFKGGKGIATTAGALLGFAPAALGTGLAAWIIVFAISKYVSLASITAALVIPTYAWIMYRSDGFLIPIILTLLGTVAIIRHKANISRLLSGTESKIEKKRDA